MAIINEGRGEGTSGGGTGGGNDTFTPGWWQASADLVRNRRPNENLTIEQVREINRQATAFQLAQLGMAGYMDLYPEVFRQSNARPMGYDKRADLLGQLDDLGAIKRQLINSGGGYISRWMIQNQMAKLRMELSELTGIPTGGHVTDLKIPDWLTPYLESSVPYAKENIMGKEQRYGRHLPPTPSLRPLGAQAELNPEQSAFMKEYTAWGKAGSPKFFTEQSASAMSAKQPWWDYYLAQSQALMPSSRKLGTRWSTASQR